MQLAFDADVEEFRAEAAKKSVSLNEAERRADRRGHCVARRAGRGPQEQRGLQALARDGEERGEHERTRAFLSSIL